MALCIMVIARVASIPLWMRSKPWAGFLRNSYLCFCGSWSGLALYQTTLETYFQTYLLPLYLSNSVCNNFYSYSDDEKYLWTLCNMWHVCWILYDLGCCKSFYRDPSWYSTDYRVYMGSSMTVRPLADCHYTCILINWSVLRHLQPRCVQPQRDIPTM